MRSVKIFFTASFMIFTLLPLSAQREKIDSLLLQLRTAKAEPLRIRIMCSLGWEYVNADELDSAAFFSNEALKSSVRHGNKDGMAAAYNNFRSIHFNLGNYNETMAYADSALKIYEELNDADGIGSSLFNLGGVAHARADHPGALGYYLRALRIYEARKDIAKIQSTQLNIGLVYLEQRQFGKALEYLFSSLELLKGLNVPKEELAICYSNIGNVYHAQQDYSKALLYYAKALRIDEETGSKWGMAFRLGNIGVVYKELGDRCESRDSSRARYDQALGFIQRSLEIRKDLNARGMLASGHGNLGELYLAMKNYRLAEEHLLKAVSLCKAVGIPDAQYEFELSLHRLYDETGDHKKALIHFKEYALLKDSVFNLEKNNELTRYEMNYEFDKKTAKMKAEREKEEAIALSEKKRQQVFLLLIASVAIALTFIAILVFRSLRITRKQKHIIEAQKELVEDKQKEVLDSIHYARRIQSSLMPTEKYIAKNLIRLNKKT